MTAEPALLPAAVRVVTFTVAGHLFAIEAGRVLEVLGPQDISAVPRAPDAVAGLVNLRGEILTVIDVRRRFAFADRAADAGPVNVIICDDRGMSGLLVDGVDDLVTLPGSLLEDPPNTLRGPARELVRSACQLDGRLVLLLDVAGLLDVHGEAEPDLSRQGAIT